MIIDFHFHPYCVKEAWPPDTNPSTVLKYLGLEPKLQSLEILLTRLRDRGLKGAVLLPVNALSYRGFTAVSNEHVKRLVDASEGFFIGFGSIDPNDTRKALREIDRAVEDLGLRGFKLHPPLQGFDPSNPSLYPVYERIAEHGVPIVFHTGYTRVIGASVYSACPRVLEPVAKSFPDLVIVLAHAGWPWIEDSIALALKYPNVYIDISPPFKGCTKSFLKGVLNGLGGILLHKPLSYKVLFGSNWPIEDPIKTLRILDALIEDKEVKGNILSGNAVAVLKDPSLV